MNSIFRYHLVPLIIVSFVLISCQNDNSNAGDAGSQQTSTPEHRKSPIAITAVKHMDTYIKIVYGQPYMRGREIFGELVPYGEVWRLGANEATEMTITSPILFGDKKLRAGTYTLFAIPDKDFWQIIVNTELGQWGAFEYDKSFDLMRVNRPVEQLKKPVEALTISFPEEVKGDQTTLSISWEYSFVEIPITFINGE